MRKPRGIVTVPSLEAAQREKAKLMANYRIAKKRELETLMLDPVHGALLRKFIATLNHFGIEHADRMVEYVRGQQQQWICFASDDIRFATLHAISNRIMNIRERAQLCPFDDVLPGEPDDVWAACKTLVCA